MAKELVIVCKDKVYKSLVDDEFYPMLNIYNWTMNIKGYAVRISQISTKPRAVFIHRVVLFSVYGEMPEGYQVDHINGNKLDNRKCNLRLVTQSQNMHNRKFLTQPKQWSSIYKGVNHPVHGKRANPKNIGWVARIQINKKKILIGRFRTEMEAAIAYDKYAKEHMGEYAKLNFPEDAK